MSPPKTRRRTTTDLQVLSMMGLSLLALVACLLLWCCSGVDFGFLSCLGRFEAEGRGLVERGNRVTFRDARRSTRMRRPPSAPRRSIHIIFALYSSFKPQTAVFPISSTSDGRGIPARIEFGKRLRLKLVKAETECVAQAV